MSSTSSSSLFDDSLFVNYARALIESAPEFKALPLKVAPFISIPQTEILEKLHAANTIESLSAAFSHDCIPPPDVSTLPPDTLVELEAAEALRFEVVKTLQSRLLAPSVAGPTRENPVGILGAGAAGLYAAMILDSLQIPYRILEARNAIGGRLFTYKFPHRTGEPYNYFDVGAMRFPVTARLQELFTKLGADFKPKIKPYAFSHDNEIRYYNGIRLKLKDVSHGVDHFRAADIIQDTPANDRQKYIRAGATAITNDVIKHVVGNGTDLSNVLKYDGYSTRAYMHTVYRPTTGVDLPPKSLPTDVINWCQTSDMSYDRGLADFVLESKIFGARAEWKCIDGGANQIAQHMEKKIQGAVELNSRVTSIGRSKDGKFMDVVTRTNNRETTHRFSHVISTIPLPVLRMVDLSRAKLSAMQSNAIRILDYAPSVKIGMQFKTAWWREEPLEITGGAQSKTDSPLRTVVYPSYGNGKSPVLMASYAWVEDAERLAALIENDRAKLIEMVLEELAKIHNVKLRFLHQQLIDTFGWSWTNNMHTMAAFAFFGPGKFTNVYRSMTVPAADGLLHFAGEALSTRHAWVEGALDSAWRAVLEILLEERLDDKLIQFSREWRANDEWKTPALPSKTKEKKTDPTSVQVWAQYEFFLRHIASRCPELFDF